MNDYSVIIPTYNSGDIVIAAIESVCQQTFSPKEIIIVDDASSDDTCKVIQGFIKDSINRSVCVRYFRLEENSGPSVARNHGVTEASNDWIVFLDADDKWEPARLERLNAFIQCEKEAKFVFSRYVDRDRRVTPNAVISFVFKLCRHKVPRWILFVKSFIATPSVALKKEIYGSGFDPSLSYCEDLDFWLKVSSTHNLYFQNETLSFAGELSKGRNTLSSDLVKMKETTCDVIRNNASSFFEKAIIVARITYVKLCLVINS